MDKEEEINRRIEMLKQKNERLMQRHKEVEADRKSAEKSGQSFNETSQYSEPPRSANTVTKRPDKTGNRPQPRAHMDEVVDDYPEVNMNNRRGFHNSRGRGGKNVSRGSPRGCDTMNVNRESPRGRGTTNANRGTPSGRGRGLNDDVRRSQEYEAKRLENYRLMEEEMTQGLVETEDSPSTGHNRFLDDPRRRGELEPEDRWKTTRHRGNYGGVEFDNVTRGMRGRGRGRGRYHRESYGRGRGVSTRLQTSAEFTGRERQDQERWLAMREAADNEIMARSRNAQGKFRREWDSEKDTEFDSRKHHDSGHSDRYDEPHINHRGGGRGPGKRGRRGSRSGHESGVNGKVNNKETATELPRQGDDTDINTAVGRDKEIVPETSDALNESEMGESKPQRPKTKQNISPRHLVQQRAQTPSSKDGTEVWAQNSHHSDETGAEWNNGARRSTEQWLPSNEGNRNPAIDERMLEQQEDGATVYSRQLGRGWGTEKNIKATKAWVVDTEKAGATKQQTLPDGVTTERKDDRNPGKMRTGNPKEDTRVKEVMSKRTGVRSASPRLKRDNPGLTIEICEDGGRRVKRFSEGEAAQTSESNDKNDIKKSETDHLKKDDNSSPPPSSVKSPQSAGVLNTPEGLEYVEDWATEMDLQSPTYESRQRMLNAAVPQQPKTDHKSLEKSELDAAPQELEVALVKQSEIPDIKNTASRAEVKNLESEFSKADSHDADNEHRTPTAEKNMSISSDGQVEPPDLGAASLKRIESADIKNSASETEVKYLESEFSKADTQHSTPTSEKNMSVLSEVHVELQQVSSVCTEKSDEIAADSLKRSPEESSNLIASGKVMEELNTSNKDSTDGNFKDANEDVEDEFYECDDSEELGKDEDPNSAPSQEELSETTSLENPVENGGQDEQMEELGESEAMKNPAAMVHVEEIQTVADEVVQQQLLATPETEGVENSVSDTKGGSAANECQPKPDTDTHDDSNAPVTADQPKPHTDDDSNTLFTAY